MNSEERQGAMLMLAECVLELRAAGEHLHAEALRRFGLRILGVNIQRDKLPRKLKPDLGLPPRVR